MESTEVIIARLVLGYLKGEQCKSAYKEFLKTSTHLQDDGVTKSKYLPTRFVGLTLENILSEYFEMYKIVQGRLESTNYYNERHQKTSLVHQLLYLLNKALSSRTSTPCPRSPIDSHLDDTSVSPAEHISDVETTPAHTLPGNIRSASADSHLHKTPWRKSHSKYDTSTTEAKFPSPDKEDHISEVLAQTLLEDREFHEKIAKTINKVTGKQNRMSSELDKTIKTVMKRTEEDPIFDKILDEIIDSTNLINYRATETSSAPSSVTKNINESMESRWKRLQKHSNSANEYDTGYRSYTDAQKVEEQNDEAIRSIIANSKLCASKLVDNCETQGNSEVVVFDGSLDKYLKANTCNANTQTQSLQNPLYINTTGGLLMIPSGIKTSSGPAQIDSSQQYYVVNKQPIVNWNVSANNPPNIITEQDILSMPTVIVSNEKVTTTPTKSILESSSLKTVSGPPKLQHIAAKPVIEIPNVDEYFTFQAAIESHQRGLRNVIYPKSTRRRKRSETVVNSKTSDTVPPSAKPDTVDVQNNTESFSDEISQIEKGQPTIDNIENDSCELKATEPQPNKNESKTPTVSETSQKVTPKSGSHVRNLDFSTPPKITSTHKRTLKSKQDNKSPLVPKKQAVKTLFKAKDSKLNDNDGHVSKDTDLKLDRKKNSRKSGGVWDADLRAIIPPLEDSKKIIPKRKRTPPIKKTKRRIRKPSKEEEHQLNATEHDAALLEAALQTPKKSEDVNTEKSSIEECGGTENVCVLPKSEHENSFEGKTQKNNCQTSIIPGRASRTKRKSKESPENNSNKLVLSPSKLNSTKRNLVKTEIVASSLTNGVTGLPTEDADKFITPEMVKETVNYPIKANRNITPMLETPLKNEFVPKTPRILSPSNPAHDLSMSICSNGFTPFTKMLEANLKGIDINSLPTPNIPITPSFPPFTPTVDLISPYSNRPTDYSTSSSYYQPSDSEQNRSLEANLKELEKKPILILSDVVVQEEIVASVSPNGKEQSEHVIVKEQVIITSESGIKNEVSKNDQNKSPHATAVKDHLSIFNKNVIGKKNLNLMKRNMSSSSSSSDDSTSSNTEDGPWNGEQSNETVIFKKKPPETPKRIYSLRNRCIGTNNKETISKSTDTIETKLNRNHSDKETKISTKPKANSKTNSRQCKGRTVVPKPDVRVKEVNEEEITTKDSKRLTEIDSFKESILKEMEEKRLRTINMFKNIQKTPSNKTTKMSKQSKFIKIKPIPNIINRRKPRKSASPKKTSQLKSENNIVNETPNSTSNKKDSKKSLMLRSCKDRDKSVDKSASDVEAQNLIEGLKERGIHLMHNKSPLKKINSTSSESKVTNEKTETSVINSKNDGNSNEDNILMSISPKTTKHELSTRELESELRETYDTQVFVEEYESVIFDESKITTKTVQDYKEILKKQFVGKVFVEEIDGEIDVPLVVSPFISLVDLPSTFDSKETDQEEDLQKVNNTGEVPQLKKISSKKDIEEPDTNKDDTSLIRDVTDPAISDEPLKSDDDLMNYAIIGSGKEETPERSDSPLRTRKRKHQSEENSHTEKKCKTLLQNINVDSFLNNIHGGR